MDLSTEVHSLSRRTRYFSPDFSPGGERLAVVESGRKQPFPCRDRNGIGTAVLRILPGTKASVPNGYQEPVAVILFSGKENKLKWSIWIATMACYLPHTRYDISSSRISAITSYSSSYNSIEYFRLDPDNGRIFR
jgi:hypothetical protein